MAVSINGMFLYKIKDHGSLALDSLIFKRVSVSVLALFILHISYPRAEKMLFIDWRPRYFFLHSWSKSISNQSECINQTHFLYSLIHSPKFAVFFEAQMIQTNRKFLDFYLFTSKTVTEIPM